jgi:phage protein D
VQGFDLLHRLTRGTTQRKFDGSVQNTGLPGSQVVSDIAQKDGGLKVSVDPTAARATPEVQNYITNLAFLEWLALENGYYLWVEEDKLFFKKRPPSRGTVLLEWGKTLMSFAPRLTTAGQVKSVEVRGGWDPIQKQPILGRAPKKQDATSDLAPGGQQQVSRGAGRRSEIVIEARSVSSSQEAQNFAEHLFSRMQQRLITGHGTCMGEPKLRVGTQLVLGRIGRFSGTYAVDRVTHSVGSGGYQTSFEVTKSR